MSTLSPEEFKNFRPISNLRFVLKIIEKCVAAQLIKYLDANCLGEVFQFAYREFHSTETTLIILPLPLLSIIRKQIYFCFCTYGLLLILLIMLFSFRVFQNALASTVLGYSGSSHIFLIAHSSSRWMGFHLIIIFCSLMFLKDLFLNCYYIQFIRPHWETLPGLMVSTFTSTLTTRNSTLRLKAPLFLIGIAAFPAWLLVLIILTPGCCVINWNWTWTRQRCWSYPLPIDLILPYLPLLYVTKWYPARLKLVTLVLLFISPCPWFLM